MPEARKQGRSLKLDLRAVGYREGKRWIAHCLELDIVAQGDTSEKALSNLAELCSTQIEAAIEEGDLRSIIFPAPPEIWQLFFLARKKKVPAGVSGNGLNRLDFRQVQPV